MFISVKQSLSDPRSRGPVSRGSSVGVSVIDCSKCVLGVMILCSFQLVQNRIRDVGLAATSQG